jgi:thiamine kinase-like enzyme
VLAGQLGIGAPVLALVRDPLALAIEYLPSCHELDVSRAEGTQRLAAAARRLHDSGARFNNDFNPFAEARKILACARQRDAELPDGFLELKRDVDRIERVLDLRFNDFVPCHNDVCPPNVLETESGRVFIVDYDLSGNGDRCYDLGMATAYFEMDADQIHRLCESYYGGNDARHVARTRLFAVASDWACLAVWLISLSLSDINSDYDYGGELENSLRRLHRTLDAAECGLLLEQAAR